MTPSPGPTLATNTPHRNYRHEAFLYAGEDGFLAGIVPFVRGGVAVGQPVMVAVTDARARPLRDALGADAAGVHFVDMAELGRNPARIIPGWRRFLDEHCQDRRPVRGVGEPIWAGRREREVAEAQLHEGLLNLAINPDTPMWLRCPYDVAALPSAVVDAAHLSHPIVVEAESYRGSPRYGGAQYVTEVFGAGLPEPSEPVESLGFGADAAGVRGLVVGRAAAAGLDEERVWAAGLAAEEVAVRTGGGSLRVWREAGALVVELSDPRPVEDPMTGRRSPGPGADDDRGLWLANQLCDLVQVRSTPAGALVRIVTWL